MVYQQSVPSKNPSGEGAYGSLPRTLHWNPRTPGVNRNKPRMSHEKTCRVDTQSSPRPPRHPLLLSWGRQVWAHMAEGRGGPHGQLPCPGRQPCILTDENPHAVSIPITAWLSLISHPKGTQRPWEGLPSGPVGLLPHSGCNRLSPG